MTWKFFLKNGTRDADNKEIQNVCVPELTPVLAKKSWGLAKGPWCLFETNPRA